MQFIIPNLLEFTPKIYGMKSEIYMYKSETDAVQNFCGIIFFFFLQQEV